MHTTVRKLEHLTSTYEVKCEFSAKLPEELNECEPKAKHEFSDVRQLEQL